MRSARRFALPRVYTGLIGALALFTTITVSASAQIDVSADPMMTKGPAAAPVTIVEFSDYQ
jgi:hypothetical protein